MKKGNFSLNKLHKIMVGLQMICSEVHCKLGISFNDSKIISTIQVRRGLNLKNKHSVQEVKHSPDFEICSVVHGE